MKIKNILAIFTLLVITSNSNAKVRLTILGDQDIIPKKLVNIQDQSSAEFEQKVDQSFFKDNAEENELAEKLFDEPISLNF